jgi:hypothetical protein
MISHRSKLSFYLVFIISFVHLHSLMARPNGPRAICEIWLEDEDCDAYFECSTCHTNPPARDSFGQRLEQELWPRAEEPSSDQDFFEQIIALLPQLANEDADADGIDNRSEVQAGTDPGDATSYPQNNSDDLCENEIGTPSFDVCNYDTRFAYKRVFQDFCGNAPNWSTYQEFLNQNEEQQKQLIHQVLNDCLSQNFWVGKDGVLWSLAHKKIRPLQAIKAGDQAGTIPLADYDDDYALFIYIMTGNRDARDLLQADYYVRRIDGAPTRYEQVNEISSQNLQRDRRAGMITSAWFNVINTMFTPVPRTTAAQAYRAYLGYDIAKSEGLIDPDEDESGPLIDYDNKGITEPSCAACHRTLDRLAYPFSRYEGIKGGDTGSYDTFRLTRFGSNEGARLDEVPEDGFILGESVETLIEWSEVAVGSDVFPQKIVLDFWMLLIGSSPKSQTDQEAFTNLWQGFKDVNQDDYRVEALLHRLVDMEVYGAP